MPAVSKIAPLSGFPEYLPADRIVEQHFLDTIREVFELHGFSSIETRSVEPVERLSAQGEDTDKEIYTLARLADTAATSPGENRSREPRLGLHFDLTVPLARYVLEHAGHLNFPFRRYQIQKVWRGERPQEGRYREFTQADVDVIDAGTLSAHFEAEMPIVVADAFVRLPMPDFVIGVNNRKIAEGFYRGLGLTDITGTLRVVDKLDKIGPDAVVQLLTETGASVSQADACLNLARIRTVDESFVDRVWALGVEHPMLEEGLAALAAVVRTVSAVAPGTIVADLKIARGLDYYTGTVYETTLLGYEKWGSFCSGGRYDSLASDGKTTYPGVGISIGVSRLVGLLIGEGLVRASRSTPACVLVARVSESEADRARSLAVATQLRRRGIACEMAPSASKFGKQIRYADRRGIPFVWFPAPGESDAAPNAHDDVRGQAENGGAAAGPQASDEVKDIRSGEQVPADATTWTPPDADLHPRVIPMPA
ncbi:MAG: histidine--tRNA ligase [Actinobacteria bacterium 69-20]|nr:histidine--tRNA ligase [Actinomycetota bacterium]OJV30964.1 MAG: histidine--tRNA ligase [Actinobacteria bacterium 69-20]